MEGKVRVVLPDFEIIWAKRRYYIWGDNVSLDKLVVHHYRERYLLSQECKVVFCEGSEVGFNSFDESIVRDLILGFYF